MNVQAFVSMPFGDDPEMLENEWTKLFNHGLLPLQGKIDGLPKNITHTPIKLWRADRNLSSLSLKVNVMKGIEQSAFVICVLTSSLVKGTSGLRLTNPNVLWELGYAEALGKPIVVMADDPSLSQLPILTGTPNVCTYNHTVVRETKAKDAPEVFQNIAKNLVPFITQALEDARRGSSNRHRASALTFSSRESVDLASMIENAKSQVDILTTNLNYFVFEKLKGNSNPFKKAIANGASIRVVTMDPESVIAEYRAKQLVRGQDVPGYRRELRQGIIELYNKLGKSPHFQLHIYNDLPLQITFRIDDTILTSVTTRGERARKRIQVQFKLYDEGVTESFVSHFQSMFDNSTDVSGLRWVTEHHVDLEETPDSNLQSKKAKSCPTKISNRRTKVARG